MRPREFAFEQMNNSPEVTYLRDMGHFIWQVEWPPRFDGDALIYRVHCPECDTSFEFRKERPIGSLRIEWVRVSPQSDDWTEACQVKQYQRTVREGKIRFWNGRTGWE